MRPVDSRLLKTLSLILLAVLVLTPAANASSWFGLGFFKEALVYILEGLIDLLVNLLNQVMRVFFDIMQDSLLAYPSMYPLKDAAGKLTPNGNILSKFMLVLVPLYVFSVLVTGAYMVFMSHSPSGRAQAKMIFDKLLVSMIIVPLSPAIYEILLKTNDVLTRSVIQVITSGITQSKTIGDAFYTSISNTPIQAKIVYLILFKYVLYSALLALLTIWFRYLCVLAMGLLFPFTLFLYLHDWTKQMGTRLLRFTLIWIYAPTIQAVWLAIGVATVQSAGDRGFISDAASPIFLTASLLMVFASPLIMSGVMKWLGGIVSAVGMLVPGPYGVALSAAGGIMQGKGVGAITSVGLKIGVSKMWGTAKGIMSRAKGGGSSTSSLDGVNPMGSKGVGGKDLGADSGPSPSAKPTKTSEEKGGGGAGEAAGGAAGKVGGKATGAGFGAAIGGAIGSVIPGVGNAVGAKIGAKIGEKVGSKFGEIGGKIAGSSVGRVAGRAAGAVRRGASAVAGSRAGKIAGRVGGGAWGATKAVAKDLANPFSLKSGGALSAFSGAYGGVTGGRSLGADLKSASKATADKTGLTRVGNTLAQGASKVADRVRESAESGLIAKGRAAAWNMRHPFKFMRGERPDAGGGGKPSGGDVSGGKGASGGEPKESAEEREGKRRRLMKELSTPDRAPQDPFKGVGERLEGMDTEE